MTEEKEMTFKESQFANAIELLDKAIINVIDLSDYTGQTECLLDLLHDWCDHIEKCMIEDFGEDWRDYTKCMVEDFGEFLRDYTK